MLRDDYRSAYLRRRTIGVPRQIGSSETLFANYNGVA